MLSGLDLELKTDNRCSEAQLRDFRDNQLACFLFLAPPVRLCNHILFHREYTSLRNCAGSLPYDDMRIASLYLGRPLARYLTIVHLYLRRNLSREHDM
jgi:hypothetical protein